MNVLHCPVPRETEMGSAGEQPVKGYRGQAHQTKRAVLTDSGRRGVVVNWRHAPLPPSSDDRPAHASKNAKELTANLCPRNRARHIQSKRTLFNFYPEARLMASQRRIVLVFSLCSVLALGISMLIWSPDGDREVPDRVPESRSGDQDAVTERKPPVDITETLPVANSEGSDKEVLMRVENLGADAAFSREPQFDWETLKQEYSGTREAALPIIERLREQFSGVSTLKIRAKTELLVDTEGLPAGTELESTYVISLTPFRVYEETSATGTNYQLTRVTTQERQVELKKTGSKNEPVFNKKIAYVPDPLYHGGLPGIESVFTWDWNGGGKASSTEGGMRDPVAPNENQRIPADMVTAESIIGRIHFYAPLDGSSKVAGPYLPVGETVWRVKPGFICTDIKDYASWGEGKGLVLPRTFQTRTAEGKDKPFKVVSRTTFSDVAVNPPVDEKVFETIGQFWER